MKISKDLFSPLLPLFRSGSVIIIGLGNPDRADDGCGIELANRLKARFPERAFSETGRNVESIVLDFLEDPSVSAFLFVDAADFGGDPGDVKLFGPEKAGSFSPSFSTHKVPLSLLAGLILQHGKKPFLLALQPSSLKFMGPVSSMIEERTGELEIFFTNALNSGSSD